MLAGFGQRRDAEVLRLLLRVGHAGEMLRQIVGGQRLGEMQVQIVGQAVGARLRGDGVAQQLEKLLQRVALRHRHVLQARDAQDDGARGGLLVRRAEVGRLRGEEKGRAGREDRRDRARWRTFPAPARAGRAGPR